jgi:hypothetical protein
MPTRNILTLRERRVLTNLRNVFRARLDDPSTEVSQDVRDTAAEIVEVLDQVIDSATIPDDKWRTKYLLKDAEAQ